MNPDMTVAIAVLSAVLARPSLPRQANTMTAISMKNARLHARNPGSCQFDEGTIFYDAFFRLLIRLSTLNT